MTNEGRARQRTRRKRPLLTLARGFAAWCIGGFIAGVIALFTLLPFGFERADAFLDDNPMIEAAWVTLLILLTVVCVVLTYRRLQSESQEELVPETRTGSSD